LSIVLVGQGSLLAQFAGAGPAHMFPPGGKIGSQFEVLLTGPILTKPTRLIFRTGITAKQKLAETNGLPEPNKFFVTIANERSARSLRDRVVGRFGNLQSTRVCRKRSAGRLLHPGTNSSASQRRGDFVGDIINGHSEANAVNF